MAVAATAAAVPIGAAILGFAQTAHVYRAVEYCLGPEPLDFDAGGNFAITFEMVARAGLYSVILTAVAVPFLVAASRSNTGPRLAAAVVAVATATAVLFIVDNPIPDKVTFLAGYFEREEQAAAHCPGGRPPWLPPWLP